MRARADVFALSANEAFLQIRPIVQLQPPELLRDQILGATRQGGAVAVEIGQPGGDDGFGHRFTPMATHRLALAINDDCVMGSWRDGQAAVKASAFGGRHNAGRKGFGRGGHRRWLPARNLDIGADLVQLLALADL